MQPACGRRARPARRGAIHPPAAQAHDVRRATRFSAGPVVGGQSGRSRAAGSAARHRRIRARSGVVRRRPRRCREDRVARLAGTHGHRAWPAGGQRGRGTHRGRLALCAGTRGARRSLPPPSRVARRPRRLAPGGDRKRTIGPGGRLDRAERSSASVRGGGRVAPAGGRGVRRGVGRRRRPPHRRCQPSPDALPGPQHGLGTGAARARPPAHGGHCRARPGPAKPARSRHRRHFGYETADLRGSFGADQASITDRHRRLR